MGEEIGRERALGREGREMREDGGICMELSSNKLNF